MIPALTMWMPPEKPAIIRPSQAGQDMPALIVPDRAIRCVHDKRGIFPTPFVFISALTWRTVATFSLSTNGGSAENYSFRNLLLVSLSSTASNWIRITVTGHSSSTSGVDNWSVGKTNTAPNTTGITELKIGGASGFSLAGGASAVSDALAFSLAGSETNIVVAFDVSPSNGNYRSNTSAPAGNTMYYKSASNSYNLDSVTGYSTATTMARYVTKIEVA